MRKSYVKPTIYLESFRMSDAVAGNCNIDVEFTEFTCGYVDPENINVRLFSNTTPGGPCTTKWNDEEHKDLGCYHNPDQNRMFFGS